MWDGATDVSVSKKETIFVLYLDKVGSDGKVLVKTEFLGLAEVSMKALSKSVLRISKNVFREHACRLSLCLKKTHSDSTGNNEIMCLAH